MKRPDTPQDELTRLQTLSSLDILDTQPEERYDRITRLAQRLFRVPMALFTLVDENRQWFKSCIGSDIRETPRDISFCGHAILEDGIFVIPDTHRDERFADNPLVVNEPHIRFYAGCPVRAADGSKLGTLCVLDRRPREFSTEDYQALQDLAAIVESELASVAMAIRDPLTGISNRRGFLTLARQSLSLCERRRVPAALVFLDLDAFKSINDNLGHGEGDRAICLFANQLQLTCRESDIPGRLGGDEFVVLLPETPQAAGEEFVTRLRQNLDRRLREEGVNYGLPFSHGIAELDPAHPAGVEGLLDQADVQMYQCKSRKTGFE